ncbi:hypothetical protein FIBSPDRAFT_463408 [Athelia psychrophila]|uniref:Uncharacterized protein n=1 Tax=Athelia psychrophila TaxID=1759441 RepID=A0A166LPH5_9AGAM|nr:hypothetical protein FIBSPDRAFT_463408 [Fibularhizoctonia sp. CBS 109695]
MEGELTIKTQDMRMRKLKLNGHPPPEMRMCMASRRDPGANGAVRLPFTAYKSVPWILPNSNHRVYSIRFGTGL